MAAVHPNSEIAELLLRYPRVDPREDVESELFTLGTGEKLIEPSAFTIDCMYANVDTLRVLLVGNRIVITKESLSFVDQSSQAGSRASLDTPFAAAHPRIWPRGIGNDIRLC